MSENEKDAKIKALEERVHRLEEKVKRLEKLYLVGGQRRGKEEKEDFVDKHEDWPE